MLCRPASAVTNSKGTEIQKKVFGELMAKLERISPGISSVLIHKI
jgi:hypothetical protein